MRVAITTPFANKQYCFNHYCKAIEETIEANPLVDFNFVAWDNSNDKKFGNRINDWVQTLGVPHIFYTDVTEHHTVDTTSDYGKVSGRVAEIYSSMFFDLVHDNTDFVFNVEDDVSFPGHTLGRLLTHLQDDQYASANGPGFNRRLGNMPGGLPIVFSLDKYGKRTPVKAKRFGVEEIDATWVGCTLFRYPILKQVGWGRDPNIGGGDIFWGHRLKQLGLKQVVDWSIRCKHWWKDKGTGEIDFYNIDNAPVEKRYKMVQIQRAGSPLFVRQEIEEK